MIKFTSYAGFTLFIMGIAVLFLLNAGDLHYRARIVPLIVLIPMIGLCLFQLLLDLVPRIQQVYESKIRLDLFKEADRRKTGDSDTNRTSVTSLRRRQWTIFAWLAGLVLIVFLIGFELGSAVFMLVFFRAHAIRWIKTLVTTAVTWMFIHYVFVWYLHTPFPKGLLVLLVHG